MVNAVNEKSGKNIDADEMYLMVLNFIHDGNINLDDVDIGHLAAKMEELLFRYPPALYSRVTFSSLQHLKQNSGGTFSLLSNTGYITGKTLRKVLALHKLDDFFDFQLYSDEAGMSKPNPEFFNVM
jgi:putative hydrolase of the HAD superfamily